MSTPTALARAELAPESRALGWAALITGLVAVPVVAYASVMRPETLVLGMALLVALGICLLRVEVALLVLVATVPLEGAIQLSGSSQLSLTKLAGALCFTSFALFALVSRQRLRADYSHGLVLLLLAIAAVSSLQARDIGIAMSTTVRYGSFVALYLIVSQLASDERLQRRLAWTMSASAAVAGGLAIHNFFDGAAPQAALPYTNANDTAFVLATTLPFTLWLLAERGLRRWAVLVMLGVISASIGLSFSRGAILGLAAAAIWFLFTAKRRALVLGLGVFVAIAATLAFIQLAPGTVETGFKEKQQIAAYNVESRLEAWSAAVDLTQKHPLVGIGPGNFREYYYEETGRPPGSQNLLVVHNAYLDVATELGLLAAVVFLLYVLLMLGRASLAKRRAAGLPGFAAALQFAFIIAAVSSLVVSEQYFAPIWLLGGIATALWHSAREAPEPSAA